MKKFEGQNGVTLVSLVVTIIILIILAGISINLVLGNNGIITIAKKAKENIELAKIEEETELNELYTQLESSGTSSGGTNYDAIAKLTEFKTTIANAIDEAGGIKTDTTAETAVFADNIKGILKEVTKDATATADNISEGKIAYVNGQKIIGTGVDNNFYYNEGKKSANSSKVDRVLVGTYDGWNAQCYGGTYDCTSIEGYQNLTVDNFAYVITKVEYRVKNYTASHTSYNTPMNYDATTGKLTINLCLNISGGDNVYLNINPSANIYCYY